MGLSGEQCPDTGGYSLEVRKEGQGLRGWASGRCFLCFSSSEHTVLQGNRDRHVLDRIPASETWDTRGVLTVQRASASAGCPPASGQGRGHLGALPHGPPAEAELLPACSPGTPSLLAPRPTAGCVGSGLLCLRACGLGDSLSRAVHCGTFTAPPASTHRMQEHVPQMSPDIARCPLGGRGDITPVRTPDRIWLFRAGFRSLLQGGGSPELPCPLALACLHPQSASCCLL